MLGRLVANYFPKIFGPGQNEPLDFNVVKERFTDLTQKVLNFNLIILY
jgi:5-oxoprolinase (ATP-hydrolysing)